MQHNPQEEKHRALRGQLYEDPAQEVHLKGAHVGVNAEVVGQVVFDLIVTEFYESLPQAELRENGEDPLEDVIDVL